MRQPKRCVSCHACAAIFLFVASTAASVPATAVAQTTSSNFGQELRWSDPSFDRGKLFDAVVDTILKRFADPDKLKELDWQARAVTARASVIDAPSVDYAVRRINALLSELKTSHTGLYTPDDYDYYTLLDIVGAGVDRNFLSRLFWGNGPYYAGIGAFTRDLDGHHFVDGILEGSPANRAGLKYGDEILSVDRTPYTPVAAFRGKIETTVDLVIRHAAGAVPEHLEVSVVPIRPGAAFSAATEASAKIIERNGHRVGYVHIWASAESTSFKNALARVGQLRNGLAVRLELDSNMRARDIKPIDSLIVDIRGRVGGYMPVAEQFLDQLAKPYWGELRLTDKRSHTLDGHNPPFRSRSALLIDHHTRSAAEIMAYGYQHSHLGTVVGTQSAGAVMSGSLVVMPGDLLLYVATSAFEFDGYALEGVGVMPDRRVERPLPYADGADPVLDAALDVLTHWP